MAKLAGRKVKVKYSGTAIAGARTTSIDINRELIDITDMDDSGIITYLDEVGTFAMEMSVEGLLDGDILHALARDNSTVLHSLVFEITGLGTYTGDFGITNFNIGGEYDANAASFSCSFVASGDVVWAAT